MDDPSRLKRRYTGSFYHNMTFVPTKKELQQSNIYFYITF